MQRGLKQSKHFAQSMSVIIFFFLLPTPRIYGNLTKAKIISKTRLTPLPAFPDVSPHAHNCTWRSKSLNRYFFFFFFACFWTGCLINSEWEAV